MRSIARGVRALSIFLAVALSVSALDAQMAEAGEGGPGLVKAPHSVVELVSAAPSVSPGGQSDIGLVFTLEKGWHVYWLNAGDSGEPPHVKWALPDAITIGPLQFPVPSRLPLGPLMDYGYEGTVAFPMPLTVAANAKSGLAHLDARVAWLVCRKVCVPGRAHLGIDLQIDRNAPIGKPTGALAGALAKLPKRLPADARLTVLGGQKDFVVTLVTGADRKAPNCIRMKQTRL